MLCFEDITKRAADVRALTLFEVAPCRSVCGSRARDRS
jgi:hypothetical protein